MRHNKLVRDKILEIIEQSSGSYKSHIANDKEYWKKLLEKLKEETEEFSKESNEQEFADILEVIEAICWFKKFNKRHLEFIKEEKQKKRGGFKKRIILEES